MIYLEPEAARIAEEIRVERIKKRQNRFLAFFSPVSFLMILAWVASTYFKLFSEKMLIDVVTYALGPVCAIGMAIDLWFDYQQQPIKNLKKLAWDKNGKLFIVVMFPLVLFKEFPWAKPLMLLTLVSFVITEAFQFAHFCAEGYRIIRDYRRRQKQKRELS